MECKPINPNQPKLHTIDEDGWTYPMDEKDSLETWKGRGRTIAWMMINDSCRRESEKDFTDALETNGDYQWEHYSAYCKDHIRMGLKTVWLTSMYYKMHDRVNELDKENKEWKTRIEKLENQPRPLSVIIMANMKDGIGHVSKGAGVIWKTLNKWWVALSVVTLMITELLFSIMSKLSKILIASELVTSLLALLSVSL